MPRTRTAHEQSLTFALPTGTATLIFPEPDAESKTVINRIPPGSGWSTPLHWHETHTEYFRVTKGFIFATVGSKTDIVGPDQGPIEVPPFTLHAFGRADSPQAKEWMRKTNWQPLEGGLSQSDSDWEMRDVEVVESTTPADGTKEAFFRNGISFYTDEIQPLLEGGVQMSDIPKLLAIGFQSMAFQSHMDNYLLMCGWLGTSSQGTVNVVGRYVTYGLGRMARMVSHYFEWDLWHEDYTPKRLWGICRECFQSGAKQA